MCHHFWVGCRVRWVNQWFPRGLSVHVSHNVPLPEMRERKGLETPWATPNPVTPNPPVVLLASSVSQDFQKDGEQRIPFSGDSCFKINSPSPSPPRSFLPALESSCPSSSIPVPQPQLFSPKSRILPTPAQGPPLQQAFLYPFFFGGEAPFGLCFKFKGGLRSSLLSSTRFS